MIAPTHLGEAHSVREFGQLAFDHVRLDWEKYVRIHDCYMRMSEVDPLLGDATKAEAWLGWRSSITMPILVTRMAEHDLTALS